MAKFRRDPHAERRAAGFEFARALLWAMLAAAPWVFVNSSWPHRWTDPDATTRDRAALVIIAFCLVFAIKNFVDGCVHAVRWRQALRSERMLRDPANADLVPPLESHVRSVASPPPTIVLLGTFLVFAFASAAVLIYGTLALKGVAPAYHDEKGADQSAWLLAVGLGLLVLTIRAFRRVRQWRVARTIERLSSEGAPSPRAAVAPDVAPARASSIARLDVVFGRDRASPTVQAVLAAAAPTPGRSASDPCDILYLRLFDNAAGTARFLDGWWRSCGWVYFLRSATQVGTDEFEAAQNSGSLTSMFVSTPEQLDTAIRRQHSRPNDEPRERGIVATWRWARNKERGRYPVQALLCSDNFWKEAIDLLLARVDLVALDLSGYRPEHIGTRYELQRVIDRYPIERVTILAEPTSDQVFLTAQIEAAWKQMADGSPNTGTDPQAAYVAIPTYNSES